MGLCSCSFANHSASKGPVISTFSQRYMLYLAEYPRCLRKKRARLCMCGRLCSTSSRDCTALAKPHLLTWYCHLLGFHCESRAYTTLFGLLFYDLLFSTDRPDAFLSMRQTAPLDLFTGDFYASHREAIETRLQMISTAKRVAPQQPTESGDEMASSPVRAE